MITEHERHLLTEVRKWKSRAQLLMVMWMGSLLGLIVINIVG